jgi:hypothetical protein
MLVVDVLGPLLRVGLVDAGFFAFVRASRVCFSHSRCGFISSTVVGDQLVWWSRSLLVLFVWLASLCGLWYIVGMGGHGPVVLVFALLGSFVSFFARFFSN